MLDLDSLRTEKFEFKLEGKRYYIPSGIPNGVLKKMWEIGDIKKPKEQVKGMTDFLASIIAIESGGPKARALVAKLNTKQIITLATEFSIFLQKVYTPKKENSAAKKKKKK